MPKKIATVIHCLYSECYNFVKYTPGNNNKFCSQRCGYDSRKSVVRKLHHENGIYERKICPRCMVEKSSSEFGYSDDRNGLLQVYCKECQSEISKRRRVSRGELGLCRNCGKNKPISGRLVCELCLEKNKISLKKYKKSKPAKFMIFHSKRNATPRGIEFLITEKDIVIPDICPVLGIPLSVGNRKSHDNSPTIDRIDSNKGYTPDNIAVISFRANRGKNNLTAYEHRKIADWLDSMNDTGE